jgi:hypothetical protein
VVALGSCGPQARVRLGERRREAKLFCQHILEKMDGERALEEHCVANADSEDEGEATFH